jgi:hypothetical protein
MKLMKRTLMLVAASLLVAAVVQAAPVKIVVEAENYLSIVPSMTKATSSVASGGAYIHIPLQRPHGTKEGVPIDQGRTSYKIKVPAKGKYRFWGRAHWHDGCGNSFFLKVGNKPVVVFGQNGTYGRWHWVRGPLLDLDAGVVTIVIQNREDGSMLDQFMLISDQRYVPVRAEKQTPAYIVK